MLCSTSTAQASYPNPEPPTDSRWVVTASTEDFGMGRGLPVFALGRSDWPRYHSNSTGTARAVRSLRFELSAIHLSGWQLAALDRTEASLEASTDAVDLAALNASGSDPAAPRTFAVHAFGQAWQGTGIQVGTPWQALGAESRWHGQVKFQIMKLRQFRDDEISGYASFLGADGYEFNLQSRRSSAEMAPPFLQPSDRSGRGASLSFFLEGAPARDWKLQLRAHDLISVLDWPRLVTEVASLNSQVIGRAFDGSLNYASLINGRNTLERATGRISTRWEATIAWSPGTVSEGNGAFFRAEQKSALSQYWFGWDQTSSTSSNPRWRVEVEPWIKAVGFSLEWKNWSALLATDGKGLESELMRLRLDWRASF